jgi:hypothetical protein
MKPYVTTVYGSATSSTIPLKSFSKCDLSRYFTQISRTIRCNKSDMKVPAGPGKFDQRVTRKKILCQIMSPFFFCRIQSVTLDLLSLVEAV